LQRDRIHIVAMDAIASLGLGCDALWSNLLDGKCGLKPLPWMPINDKQGAFYGGEIPQSVWDELASHFSGDGNSKCRDLAVAVGWNALYQGRPWLEEVESNQIGLVLSSIKGDMNHFEAFRKDIPSPWHYDLFGLANDVAKTLGIGGPVLAVSNACASGLVATSQGARLIQSGDARLVLVIGVENLSRFIVDGFMSLRSLSTGPCRPFDQTRDGLSLGSGAGALLLASGEGQPTSALASIKGWSCTNDATHITAPAMGGAGLQAAIRQALTMADLEPSDIGYINAHGTGTVFNDEMEAQAYYGVFGPDVPLTVSLKGYLGHTLGAAGVLEAILSVMVLNDKQTPASLGFSELGVGQPLRIPTENTPISDLRFVLSSKVGFGGINAVMVFGEPA
jgi:3-oxoacyl-(acyl-carrier-protein) synthase